MSVKFKIEHKLDGWPIVMTGKGGQKLMSKDRIVQLLNEKAGWISVKDRLPEHDQEVMTYSGDMPESMPAVHKMGVTRYTKNEREYFYGGGPDEGYQVSHWMSLPEPPRGEDR